MKQASASKTIKSRATLAYLSPRRMLLGSGMLLFAFTLVPPKIYEYYIHEPNFMFGNVLLYLFLLVCLAIVWLGILLGEKVPSSPAPRLAPLVRVSPFLYLLIPVVLALFSVSLTLYLLVRNEPELLVAALSGQGETVKTLMLEGAGQDALTGTLPLALGICWWVYAEYLSIKEDMSRYRNLLIKLLIGALVLFLCLVYFIMMSRAFLMPLLFGLLITNLKYGISNGTIRIGSLARRGALAAVSIVLIFGLIASMRTGGRQGEMTASFIGYGPASLNHLAAIIDGRFDTRLMDAYLRLENFGFLYKFPFAIRLMANAQVYTDAYVTSFNSTWRAGLNGAYIWFTSYGEIAAGLGVLAAPYLFVYGFVVGRAWKGFCRNTITGKIIYPWAVFSLLFTFGYNYFAGRNLSIFLVLILLLWVYSGFVRPRRLARVA
jgi:hypothetical protein